MRGLVTAASVVMAFGSVAMVEGLAERLNGTRGRPGEILIHLGLLKLAPIVVTLLLLFLASRGKTVRNEVD